MLEIGKSVVYGRLFLCLLFVVADLLIVLSGCARRCYSFSSAPALFWIECYCSFMKIAINGIETTV